jgi:hypothetical protein
LFRQSDKGCQPLICADAETGLLRELQASHVVAFALICPTGKSVLIFRSRVKPLLQKYFASRSIQISSLIPAVLPTEGRAHVTNAERDAVDAAASGEQ